MASDIPHCSLENKLASGTWDSSVFVLNEFINPNIGNMDGSRNGILVEEEQVSGNFDFFRGGGEYYPLSNGDCERAGGPGSTESVLWDDWDDFRFSGSVRQSGDLCSLSNTDFHIEGSGLRGNWKDGEDFMVDSLGSKYRIDCTTMLLAVADWMNTLQVERENFEETACYRDMCFKKGRTNEDHAMLGKSQFSARSNCGWYAPKTCPGQHKATWEPVPCYEPLNLNELIRYGDYEPICWEAIESVEPGATASDVVSCYEDYESVKHDELLDKIELVDPSYKGAHLTSLKDGALLGDFHASGEGGFPRQLEESNDGQHKATWEPVPCYEPPNLNELIHYGDYEPICWDDTIETTRVERGAIVSDVVSCYEDYESVKQDELLDKIELVNPSYKGARLTCLKDGALLGDFQASGEAGYPRQMEESNDRQQESPAKDRDDTRNLRLQTHLEDLSTALGVLFSRQLEETNDRWQESSAKKKDDTGNIRVQAALGDLSMKTSAYYDSFHFALFLTLSYLDLQDLISVEKVCKSLHTAVKGESFLWQNIHVEHPLSERLTDDALLELAARSQGRLRSLSLAECQKITDDGLKQVLDMSPNLTKLCLPACTRLTADGIVRNVRAHKECSMTGLKQLRIGGLFGITREHLEQLNYILDSDLQQRSPRFFPNGRYFSLSDDDDNAIDIEACPKCGDARLVYDCTKESCQNKTDHTVGECRACTFCIARCDVCGKCIDGEYEETFNLDMRCAECVQAFQPPRFTIRTRRLHLS